MRPIRLLFALAGAVALAGTPMQAGAQCVFPIEWGEANAYETNRTGNISTAGSNLTVVGEVVCFSGIFSSYQPIPAGREYTVYLSNFTSLGTNTIDPPGPPIIYQTTYVNGRVQIFEGPKNANYGTNPPNATSPSTFTDGTLFLDGTMDSITVTIRGDLRTGNFDGHESGIITGGSYVDDNYGPGGATCQMNVTGGWNVTPSALIPGYWAEVAGKVDAVDCVVQTQESSSWGRMKSLYR